MVKGCDLVSPSRCVVLSGDCVCRKVVQPALSVFRTTFITVLTMEFRESFDLLGTLSSKKLFSRRCFEKASPSINLLASIHTDDFSFSDHMCFAHVASAVVSRPSFYNSDKHETFFLRLWKKHMCSFHIACR